jgi:membrane protein YqaA with SNARE-associated domain
LAVPIWQHGCAAWAAPGLILLGLADNSVIPLTGSMDVLTIWLAARHREPWPYYALMATLGAVIGGYITYAIARKGGKETMDRKLSKKKAARLAKAFERWGFFAVAVPALAASAVSLRSLSAGGGRIAVLAEKISGSAGSWPRPSLLHRGLPGIPLRPPHPALLQLNTTNPRWRF